MECTIISPLEILSFQPQQLLHTSFRQLFFQISDLPRQGFGHLFRMNLGRGPWVSQLVSLARANYRQLAYSAQESRPFSFMLERAVE